MSHSHRRQVALAFGLLWLVPARGDTEVGRRLTRARMEMRALLTTEERLAGVAEAGRMARGEAEQ